MHDIRLIRDDPAAFDAGLARQGIEPIAQKIVDIDKVRRALITDIENLRSKRKQLSGSFGQLASQGQGQTMEALEYKTRSIEVANELSKAEGELTNLRDLNEIIAALPNLPAADLTAGEDDADNVEIERKSAAEGTR